MSDPRESPSQTAGPYVHIGCTPNFAGVRGVYAQDLGAQMLNDDTTGTRITLSGVIFDGAGAPLLDAMVEIWQADANGMYAGMPGADAHFGGWGRCPSDQSTGRFIFETIKPGAHGDAAPFVTLWIVARGINLGLHARLYFEDEAGNATDPFLSSLTDAQRQTLLCRATPTGYEINIHLQGSLETVFLDI
jgi:protocatechuate 3,4-dioxygenase alpha subunit